MQIDWEEHLSRLVGDIAAHRLVSVFNEVINWSASATSNLTDDVSEYLQEESRDVVSGPEMDIFFQQVDRLRDDTERLLARTDRLSDLNRQ
jgi:ubiquinone biosynthesis protein UbiJ